MNTQVNIYKIFKHSLLFTFRHLKRFNSTLLINIIGLAAGFTCAFFIYLWMEDELSFDKFHDKDKHLYQVVAMGEENHKKVFHESLQFPLGEALENDLPEVEHAVPVFFDKEGFPVGIEVSGKTIKANCVFSGKEFFKVFSFKLLEGKQDQALQDKHGAIISEALAVSLFGSPANSVGKQISWELLGNKKQVLVSGVLEKLPHNSSLQFDILLHHNVLIDLAPNLKEWNNEPFNTYLILKEGTNIERFNARIKDFLKKYNKETVLQLFIRPYSSAYLYGKYENGVQTGGRIEYVRIFGLIALLILTIACINFMNLATAKASRRMKEIGIKKTVGASKQELIIQFLGEAMITVILSIVVAAILVYLLLPVFNEVTGKQLEIAFTAQTIFVILTTIFITGIIAGSYPAFYLSSLSPMNIFKQKLKNPVSELLARKGLVVFQFTVSLILIVSVLVIYRQMQYIQSENLGFNRANIIQFEEDGNIHSNLGAFLTELKRIPGVENASAIQTNIIQSSISSSTYGISWPGKSDQDLTQFAVLSVDYGLIETLGIQVKEGHSFSRQFGSDSLGLIFNETAIRAMGLEDPIGKKVNMWGKEMTIKGVVKDFNRLSLHEAIMPLVFRCQPRETNTIMAKIAPGNEDKALQRIRDFYREFNPGYGFNYKFLDESYQKLYVIETRIAALTAYFAVLAILISCLGLFGLATFNAQVRVKEIGIRKALGASASGIVVMLSKDFVKLVAIAITIAFPIGWWVMNEWLTGFVYHTGLQWWIFGCAGCSAIIIATITVSFQATKAARANPIKSLRTE